MVWLQANERACVCMCLCACVRAGVRPTWRGGRHFHKAEFLPLLRISIKLVVCLSPHLFPLSTSEGLRTSLAEFLSFHTIPHKYSSRQEDAFEYGCADGAGPNSRRGSHVYEINTWLWKFGRPQPRVGGLSVAKTEKIRRKSRSEASKRGWATKKARK